MEDKRSNIRLLHSLADISPAEWDAVANPNTYPYDPFLSWAFLDALETSAAATPETGWTPCHLVIDDADGVALGVMPLYAKTHSQGEFVFDYAWADAYHRAGGDYYPKLLGAVPFTPVTGRRILIRPDADAASVEQALINAAVELAAQNDLSSLHLNFVTPEASKRYESLGLLIRTDQQFHWENQDYADFDGFLAQLSSAKRKNLRKERKKAQDGLQFKHLTGTAITEAHWDAFYHFYQDTSDRKWGSPYLNRETFSIIGQRMADQVLLILAYDGDQPIAGALNFIGSDTLYGRYWGAIETRPMLHFETCYYQAMDFAIKHGLKRVEAGAQGGHKLARGYVPTTTYSAHWIAHAGLRHAIDQYLENERQAVDREADYLRRRTPFKASTSATDETDE